MNVGDFGALGLTDSCLNAGDEPLEMKDDCLGAGERRALGEGIKFGSDSMSTQDLVEGNY